MANQVKDHSPKEQVNIKSSTSKKFDMAISTAIVVGAVLLVGLIMLNSDVIW